MGKIGPATVFVRVGVLLLGCATLTVHSLEAQTSPQHVAPYVYCGKNLKSMILFETADFKSKQIAVLDCGEAVSLLSSRDDWARIRTKKGVVGYEPTWFIGPPSAHVSGTGKCNRPSPLENVDQFDRLSAKTDSYIDAGRFTPADFDSVSKEDTEKLAASAYFAAYLSSDNPSALKNAISKSVIEGRVFGKDFANLTAIQKIDAEVYLQKLLNVVNKAMDLGFQDGSKYPCNPKGPAHHGQR